jgi:hypothetical protein
VVKEGGRVAEKLEGEDYQTVLLRPAIPLRGRYEKTEYQKPSIYFISGCRLDDSAQITLAMLVENMNRNTFMNSD